MLHLQELERRQNDPRRNSLLDFTTATCPHYQVNWHHRLVASYLDRFARGEITRLIINQPPQTGKSELASRRLPAYLLGNDADCRIIAASYSADLASDMNRDVQQCIDSDAYADIFPGTRLNSSNVRTVSGSARRNADIFDVVGRRGFYKSAGVRGPITGKSMDVGVIDDPIKNREEADSPVFRDAVWNWYTSTFLSRVHKDTKILVVMTRWNEDDLTGRLLAKMEDPKADQWTVLSLQSLAEDDDRHPEDLANRKLGEALWRDMHPLEELEKIRAVSPTDFASQHQQKPRPEGGTEWPDSYFGPGIWFADWPANLKLRGIGLDPSKGKSSKWGDYSAYIRLGLASDMSLWCEADLSNTRQAERIVADGCEHQRQFNADVFSVESDVFQELFQLLFQQEAARQGIMLPIVPTPTGGVNKLVRIRRLGPYLAAGKIRFKGGSPGTRLLVQQLRAFPLCRHDDGPDALEQTVRAMIAVWNGRQQPRTTRVRS